MDDEKNKLDKKESETDIVDEEIAESDVSKSVGIDDTLSGAEHYSKLYKDLPEDVVKMLMSTHPIYGEKAKKKLKDEPKIKKEIKDEPVLEKPKKLKSESEYMDTSILEEPVKPEEKPDEPTLIKETLKSEKKDMKKRSKNLYKDEEYEEQEYENENYEETEEDYEEENEDDEKEFLYSLFSKKDRDESSGSGRYILTGVLTIALIVCIIGMSVNIIQNTSNKKKLDILTKEKEEVDRKLNNNEVLLKASNSEKESLQSEVESLRNEISSSNTQPPQSQPENTESNSDSNTSDIPTTSAPNKSGGKKTYKVVKGDTLWKISVNQYGVGSQKYVDAIMKANNLKSANDLKVGATLTIPDI